MGDEEWEQLKREEAGLLDHWLSLTDAQIAERRRQVKARGYPRGWTENEPEDARVPEGRRVLVLGRVEPRNGRDG